MSMVACTFFYIFQLLIIFFYIRDEWVDLLQKREEEKYKIFSNRKVSRMHPNISKSFFFFTFSFLFFFCYTRHTKQNNTKFLNYFMMGLVESTKNKTTTIIIIICISRYQYLKREGRLSITTALLVLLFFKGHLKPFSFSTSLVLCFVYCFFNFIELSMQKKITTRVDCFTKINFNFIQLLKKTQTFFYDIFREVSWIFCFCHYKHRRRELSWVELPSWGEMRILFFLFFYNLRWTWRDFDSGLC